MKKAKLKIKKRKWESIRLTFNPAEVLRNLKEYQKGRNEDLRDRLVTSSPTKGNMSFFLTVRQFRARSKGVTRRLGWWDLKAGDLVMGVVKGQGIPKGGHVERLGLIRIRSVKRERLSRIRKYGQIEVCREGFPLLTCGEFIEMFCRHNKCTEKEWVNRIEFEYVEDRDFAQEATEATERKKENPR